MHSTLIAIQNELKLVIQQLEAHIPNDEPLGPAHGNWSFPGLTKSELIDEARLFLDLIEHEGAEDIGTADPRLLDYVRRLRHLQQHTIPQIWGSAQHAVPAYLFTLGGLRKALTPALKKNVQAESSAKLRKVATQIRGMESTLNGLQTRTSSLDAMIQRIEEAYDAADQLPADLESLSEARETITAITEEVIKDQGRLLNIRETAEEADKSLKESAEEAQSVLERCESAYSAATSVGLAAAFSERSKKLSESMWIWVAGLILALGLGSFFGSKQLHSLSEVFTNPDISTSLVTLNLALSILSVGAPIWFAWLSTKQIGQRFRLSEDYAFKASVSRAYEGFRREAARFDKEMESRLLNSALSRLEELPLRLVEPDSHGSPWHELASSEQVKNAMKMVPSFADDVKSLASKTLNNLTSKPKSVLTTEE